MSINYKEEVKDYFDGMQFRVDELQHSANSGTEKIKALKEEHKKRGDKWFYFEYIRSREMGTTSAVRF